MAEMKTCETCGQGVQDIWSDPFEGFDKMHNKIMDIWEKLHIAFNGEDEEKNEQNAETEENSENKKVSLGLRNFSF